VPSSVSGESVGRCRLVDFDMGRQLPVGENFTSGDVHQAQNPRTQLE
jgi:hypothetical protein